MVTVEVNLDNIMDLKSKSEEMVKNGLQLTAQDLIRNLMINSPVDHGLLKQWAVTSQSDNEITVQSPAIYAAAQNYGSTHFIAPKNKKALHWGGSPGFFSKGHEVTIPGKHFVETSINQTTPRIGEFFKLGES